MGRISGGVLIGLGLLLWYVGGRSGGTAFVNLGIGSILLGLVLLPMPGRGHVGRDALELTLKPNCAFLSNLVEDLGLRGKPVFIPPCENLPGGGLFIPASDDFSIPLGKLGGGTVLVAGPRSETGLLVSPAPGSDLLDYVDEDLTGKGVPYAASAVSSALSALGLGRAEVFEEEGRIDVFVRPICRSPYADPVTSAVLMALAVGSGELLSVEDVRKERGYLKVTVKRLGGVERWL